MSNHDEQRGREVGVVMVKYTFDENPGKRFDAAMTNLWQSNPAYREQVAAERADERRVVIEELAKEAEEHVEFYVKWFEFEDDYSKQVAAWLRAHVEEEG